MEINLSRDILKALTINKKWANSAFKYTLYFEFLAWKIEEYSIQPEFLYNMDEKRIYD